MIDVYKSVGLLSLFLFQSLSLIHIFAIAIRTMILKNQKAYVQAGAGVVYDSVPENEFYETINKAKAMTRIGDAQ